MTQVFGSLSQPSGAFGVSSLSVAVYLLRLSSYFPSVWLFSSRYVWARMFPCVPNGNPVDGFASGWTGVRAPGLGG